MSEQSAPQAKTIREEVNALFGVRWDTLMEWVVISWLSLWFWSSFRIERNLLVWDGDGPLTGTESFLRSVDIAPPTWVSQAVDWILDPSRGWLSAALVVLAVVSCVTAVRSYRLSGLRTLALLSVAVVCEIAGSLWPVVWVLSLAAIPAAIAWGISFVNDVRKKSGYDEYTYYYGNAILSNYFARIVLLFFAPVLAPALLAGQLVVSFRTELPRDAAAEISREVRHTLEARGFQRIDELDALTVMAASAAIQLAGNDSREAREILGGYQFELVQRREAEALHARSRKQWDTLMGLEPRPGA
ncbi:MAG: hypothetical protein J0H23_12780 [Micrococcales bacterium]|nr:hypothetical protein [Micrococcales bacterium]OJX69202.1 MAG: hypothetical protein BGO94_11655 [Micrococcales bacterium 72-143]